MLTSNRTKKSPLMRAISWALAINMLFTGVGVPGFAAFAAPTDRAFGGTVVGGFDPIGDTDTTIKQNTKLGVINWGSFGVDSAGLEFITPGSGSLTVNYVTGGGYSEIAGALSSNGSELWLLNPSGISIAKGASISGTSFLASTADISGLPFGSFTGDADDSVSLFKDAATPYLSGADISSILINSKVAGEGVYEIGTSTAGGGKISITFETGEGGVSGSMVGEISANELELAITEGGANLSSLNNAIDQIYGNVGGGSLSVNNSAAISIGDLTVTAAGVANAHLTINAAAGDITQIANSTINVKSTARLTATAGDLKQEAGASFTAGGDATFTATVGGFTQKAGASIKADNVDVIATEGGFTQNAGASISAKNAVLIDVAKDIEIDGEISSEALYMPLMIFSHDGGITLGESGSIVALESAIMMVAQKDITLDGEIKATLGGLELNSVDGNIKQGASGSVVLNGAKLTAAGNITLNSVNNDFKGRVNATGINIDLADNADGIQLGKVDASGTLDVTSTGTDAAITQTAVAANTVKAAGAATLNATTGSITLENVDNDFNSVTAHADKGVKLQDANAIILTDVDTLGGDIVVTALGKITAADVANTGAGATTLTGANVELGLVDAVGALTVTATGTAGSPIVPGDITSAAGSVVTAGSATLTATGNITLAGSLATTSGGAIIMGAGDDIVLGATHSGDTLNMTVGGSITQNAAVKVTGITDLTAGAGIKLENIDNNFNILDAKVTGAGNISIIDEDDINLRNVSTVDGSIQVEAVGLLTATGVKSRQDTTANNNITLTGVGIEVGVIDASTTGNVTLDAGGGSIAHISSGPATITHDADGFADWIGADPRIDNIIIGDELNVANVSFVGEAANPLNIQVNTVYGSVSDSIWLYETDDLTIGLPGLSGDGGVSVETIKGTLTVNGDVTSTGGSVFLAANNYGDMPGVTADVIINTANVTADGDITVLAKDDVIQYFSALDAKGSIYVRAKDGSITMSGDDTTLVSSTAGDNIHYIAGKNAAITGLDGANVLVQAGGNIIDAGDDRVDVTGEKILLIAGGDIGGTDWVSGDHDDINAAAIDVYAKDLLAAYAGGSAYIESKSALTIGEVAAGDIIVKRHTLDGDTPQDQGGTAAAARAGVYAEDNNKIKVVDDYIWIKNDVIAKTGDLLLLTETTDPTDSSINVDITLNAGVELKAEDGLATVIAAGKFDQGGNITAGDDVFVQAAGGEIKMDAAAVAKTTGGDIRYEAKGDVSLGQLDAGVGVASVISKEGSILDANPSGGANIIASAARLSAGEFIGEGVLPVPAPGEGTDVNTSAIDIQLVDANGDAGIVAAEAGKGIYLQSGSALVVGSVDPASINKATFDSGMVEGADDTALAGLDAEEGVAKLKSDKTVTVSKKITAAEDILILTTSGDIIINDGNGDGSDILLNSTDGRVSLIAAGVGIDAGDVTLNDSISADSDIHIQSFAGDISMASDATIKSINGNLLVDAKIDATVTGLSGKDIRVQAGKDIIKISAADDVDITATGDLQLVAGGSIGDADGGLGSDINTKAIDVVVGGALAAHAGSGSVYIESASDLEIGATEIKVERATFDSGTEQVFGGTPGDPDAGKLAGIEAGVNAKVKTVDADLIVSEAITAEDGDVLLLAASSDPADPAKIGNIKITADIAADADGSTAGLTGKGLASVIASGSVELSGNINAGGDVFVEAGKGVAQNADITSKAGNISVTAADGDITMAAGTKSTATGKTIRYVAADGDLSKDDGNIKLSILDTGNGTVSVIADGSITDANFGDSTQTANISAFKIRLKAGDDIGGANSHADDENELAIDITTTATSLNIEAEAGGGMHLQSDAVTAVGGVHTLAFDTKRATFDSGINAKDGAKTDVNINGITTGRDAKIKVVGKTLGVFEIFNAGGDALLMTENSGDITIGAYAPIYANGLVTIIAADSITQGSQITAFNDVYIKAGKSVTQNAGISSEIDGISVTANNGDITMAAGTESDAILGNIRYEANGAIALASLNANKGNVSVVAKNGGSIADANGDESANITAGKVRLETGTDITGNIRGNIGAATPSADDFNAQAIDISADKVEAFASGSVYLQSDKKVTVGGVGDLEFEFDYARFDSGVTTDDSVTAGGAIGADENLVGIKAENGVAKLKSAGDVAVDEDFAAAEDALILATTGDILVNAEISADKDALTLDKGLATVIAKNGSITLNSEINAGRDVYVEAGTFVAQNADITSMEGGISVTANDGDIKMAAGTKSEAVNGNIRYAAAKVASATDEGDVALGHLNAGAGDVSVVASGSILDANRGDAALAETANITAGKVRLEASNGSIGGANGTASDINAQAIDIAANNVEAKAASGSVYLQSAGALEVGGVGDLEFTFDYARFDSGVTTDDDHTASGALGADLDLTGIEAGDNAMVKVDGANLAVNEAITAAAGDALLLTTGAGNISVNAAVTAGDLATAIADGVLNINADISAGRDVYVTGVKGVSQTDGTMSGQNLKAVSVEGDIIVRDMIAAQHVSIQAGGKIADGNGSANNINAETLWLDAGGAIDLDIEVDNVMAKSGGAAALRSRGNITLGGANDVAIGRAFFDAGEGSIAKGSSPNGLVVGGNATLTSGGTISQTSGSRVQIRGLSTLTASGDIILGNNGNDFGGDVTAAGNNIKLQDSNDLTLNTVKARGKADIGAKGSILASRDNSVSVSHENGFATVSGGNKWNIDAKSIALNAGRNIGSASGGSDGSLALGSASPLSVKGPVAANAGGDIALYSPDNMLSLDVRAGGTANLTAANLSGSARADNIIVNTADIAGRGAGNAVHIGDLSIHARNQILVNHIADGQQLTVFGIFDGDWSGSYRAAGGYGAGALVFMNGQLVGGDARYFGDIAAAESFPAETPELKSSQGVFGDVTFAHIDLDISEPIGLGLIENLYTQKYNIEGDATLDLPYGLIEASGINRRSSWDLRRSQSEMEAQPADDAEANPAEGKTTDAKLPDSEASVPLASL